MSILSELPAPGELDHDETARCEAEAPPIREIDDDEIKCFWPHCWKGYGTEHCPEPPDPDCAP